MKLNKILVGLILAITLVFLTTTFISAAVEGVVLVTIQDPLSDSLLGGVATLNISINSSVAGNFSCDIYARSTLTANSTWGIIATLNNHTASGGGENWTNASFDSTIFEDADNYEFNASCFNYSNSWTDATTSGIRIDNTIPTAPVCTPASTTQSNATLDIVCSVTGTDTTNCTLYFSGITPGSPSYKITHSGDTCTQSISPVPEQTYRYYAIASDATNTTISSTFTTMFDFKTSAGKAAQMIDAGKAKTKGGALMTILNNGVRNNKLMLIIVFGVAIVVITLIVKRKKK